MRKKTIVLTVGVFIGVAILLFTLGQCSKGAKGEYIKPAEKTSFDEVTAKLNPGGGFYLYVGAERVIKAVDEFAAKLRQIIQTYPTEAKEDTEKALKIYDFIYGLVKNSGIMEISGVGVSSVATGEKLNHSKVVVHHYKDKGKGLIWQLADPAPHEMILLKMLPADTVMAGYIDFKFNTLWTWIKTQVNASDLPDLKKGLLSVEPMLQQQGIQLEKLLGSLVGIGYALSLDSTVKCKLPLGQTPLEIPEPALAIFFSVKDDYVFNLIKSKLPMGKTSEEKGMKKLQIPLPPGTMPFTVEPTLVHKDYLLILASNNKIVEAMLAALEKKNGLMAGEEFKKLSDRVPTEGNSFRFVSSRFFQTFREIQQKAMETGETKEDATKTWLKQFYGMLPKEIAAFGTAQRSEEGMVSTFNHTMGLEGLVLLPATAVAGVVAAIAVPNLLTAIEKGKQKATMGDLRTAPW